MKKSEFLELLASILNEDPQAVKPETELESLGGWDSTGLLGVMATFDSEFGVVADVDPIRNCKTVQDLMNIVGDKLE